MKVQTFQGSPFAVSRTLLLLSVPVLLTLLGSCSGYQQSAAEYAPAVMKMEERGDAPPEAEMAVEPGALKAAVADGAAEASATAEPPARSRIYSASLELEVPRVEETRGSIEELTEEAGGRVEGIHPEGIIVLVPAAELFAVLKRIEALGTVLDRSLEAWDVTDSLADLEIRLNLAVEARERLYRLLEQADETEERVAILREIRRLSEQIESYRISLETMRERIAFSRISILLRSSLGDSREALDAIPFPWMRNLDPFGVSLGRLEGRYRLDPGPKFAVFREPPAGEAFYAESAAGAVIRLGSTRNEPEGDALFWQKSMRFYLAPLYAQVVPFDLQGEEPLYGVSCTIPGNPGYIYDIFALPRKGSLYIAEGLFPLNSEPGLREAFHLAVEGSFR
jgi:Domain of unknown function (DUF4349)